METFTAYTVEGMNQFSFDLLVKNSTYNFLHFFPRKDSPEKVKMMISLFEKDNTLIEEHDFVLEIDSTRKKYREHHIGLLQNGMIQKLIFTALNPENNNPLEKICICVAVAKIKDGDDGNHGGNYLRPRRPKSPVLIES